MSIVLDNDSFDVIGSTVTFTPDNLPRRLRPIYRRRGNDQVWFTALTRERDESVELARLDPDEARALAEDGHARIFSDPFPARRDHVLIQLAWTGPPDYVATGDVALRLREAETDALRRAATAFANDDMKGALRFIWYARRARLDDPLPLLLLQRLLTRFGEPPEDLAVLASELREYGHDSIGAAYRRLRTDARLVSFGALNAFPSYLHTPARVSLAEASQWARARPRRAS